MTLVGLICCLNLFEKILFLLRGRLVRLESAKYLGATRSRLARPGAVVLLRKGIVFGLALAHGLFEIGNLLLCCHAVGLPALATPLGVGSQLDKILMHLVQGSRKIGTVLGHSIVNEDHLVVRFRK